MTDVDVTPLLRTIAELRRRNHSLRKSLARAKKSRDHWRVRAGLAPGTQRRVRRKVGRPSG